MLSWGRNSLSVTDLHKPRYVHDDADHCCFFGRHQHDHAGVMICCAFCLTIKNLYDAPCLVSSKSQTVIARSPWNRGGGVGSWLEGFQFLEGHKMKSKEEGRYFPRSFVAWSEVLCHQPGQNFSKVPLERMNV